MSNLLWYIIIPIVILAIIVIVVILARNGFRSRKSLRNFQKVYQITIDDLKRIEIYEEVNERKTLSKIYELEKLKRKLFEDGISTSNSREQKIIARKIKEIDGQAAALNRALDSVTKHIQSIKQLIQVKDLIRVPKDSSFLEEIDLKELFILLDKIPTYAEFDQGKITELLACLDSPKTENPKVIDQDVAEILQQLDAARERENSQESKEDRELPEEDANFHSCPFCGFPLPANSINCTNCGRLVISPKPLLSPMMVAKPTNPNNTRINSRSNATASILCPICGTSNKGDARFCQACGRELEPTSLPQSAHSPTLCPNCGNNSINPDGYCGYCGSIYQSEYSIPSPITDEVNFSITAPQIILPESSFTLKVWAHLAEEQKRILKLAQIELNGNKPHIETSYAGLTLARGNVLQLFLDLPGFMINNPRNSLRWQGRIGSSSFLVRAQKEIQMGYHSGTVNFHLDELLISRLDFTLFIGEKKKLPSGIADTSVKLFLNPFVSYSHEDSNEVYRCVQCLEKFRPGVKPFVDVEGLRSGEDWKEKIREKLGLSDILYLFWSKPASLSKYVGYEWQTMLSIKGVNSIDPLPLVHPNLVPPPPELAHLHFDDKWLYYMETNQGRDH